MSQKTITLERTFAASLEDVWALWTTKDGIESWWGPDGFRVEVRSLDLRPGGELRYAMIAVRQQEIDFMKQAGMPVTQELKITYDEIVPLARLRYTNLADFIPGVAPYDVATLVELEQTAAGVRLRLTIDAMHAEEWTKMAVSGWESELGKLEKVLAVR
jgi:uncharacterized protein YndB with AHSA1/START domain